MRPLKLAVQGFTCFRQFTEIDFQAMELYAIQGPTGSGKSSILDAMMYALYGQTPRLGKVGHDALISQGERALSISLEFESGGARYRVGRTKGRRQADNEVRFESWNGERFVGLTETKKAGTQQAIEKAVGLNFDSFTRAVVLPQGQFDRFLRGSGKERQELLGALLDLEHYKRMAERANERKAALTAELRAKQTLLDGEYAALTPELLNGWKAEAQGAEREAARWNEERARLQAQIAELEVVAGLSGQLLSCRAALADLEARRAGIEEGAARALRARRVAGVLPLMDARDRARESAERAARNAGAAREEAERAARDAARAEEERQAALVEVGELPALEERAEALREGERLLATLKRHGGSLALQVDAPQAWDEDAFLNARAREAQARELAIEAGAIETEGREIEGLRLRLARDDENLAAWRVQLDQVTEQGKGLRDQHTAAAEELRRAREREGALALRHHLQVGAPCPLCEGTVRALPPAATVDVAALEGRARTLEEALSALRERHGELRATIKASEATLIRDRSDLYRREETLEHRRAALREREAAVTGDAQAEARRLLAGLAQELRALGTDPAAARRGLLADIAARRTRLDAAREGEAKAHARHAAAQAALAAAEREAASRAAEREAAEAILAAALDALDLSEEEARDAALSEARISALEQDHRAWSAKLEQSLANVADLEGELAGRTHDEARLRETRGALLAAESSLSVARRRAADLSAQVRVGEEKLTRKRELEAGLAALSRDLDTWAALAQALRANEFQQYLLAEVESNLLERAGELLFEISDGRYRLLLDGGEYSVQDLWNAGETRGVKTLSGGETFLASLALAIALSDYLAGNSILGALFLDEGFGTLDPQALEAVAGALEKVRTQGRMVGVITHVESLSERLPARILVSKSVAGSRALRME